VINRIKAVVLGLFAVYWVIVVVILVVAPEVADQAMRLQGRLAEIGALLVLTALFGLLSTGVIRNWRWTFWLILVAFMANGILRVPIAGLQLAGIVPGQGPPWYLSLQAIVGLFQFVIALAMLAGYRRAGVWGEF
jgi:hypothetical protein